MAKTERERLTRQENVLCNLGFTRDESDALRRISRTLRRWLELECGTDSGAIERDDATGKPYWMPESGRKIPVADRERGALRRLGRIVGMRNTRVLGRVERSRRPRPRRPPLRPDRPARRSALHLAPR